MIPSIMHIDYPRNEDISCVHACRPLETYTWGPSLYAHNKEKLGDTCITILLTSQKCSTCVLVIIIYYGNILEESFDVTITQLGMYTSY